MREHQPTVTNQTKRVISATTHHTFKLKLSVDKQKRKAYFARIRGYRDRK